MKIELKARPCDAPWRDYVKPEGTKECSGMIDGWLRTWTEYVPSSYDGSSPVPVVRTHGSEDTMQPMGGLGKICVMAASGEERPIDHSEQARYDKWIVRQKINLDVYKDCGAEEIFAILKKEYQARADAYKEKEKVTC